jgi:hypothetical protein
MDKYKLNDIYEYFLGETEKASEKYHMYDMVDMVVCRRICELLRLLITKDTEF